MSYKRNANANRDALFGAGPSSGGAAGGGGSKKSSSNAANRNALFGNAPGKKSTTSSGGGSNKASSKPPPASNTSRPPPPRVPLSKRTKKPALKGEARTAKLKQAEDFRDKANACMKSSIFRKPDPVAASTYYKRAAEAYQQAGDCDRLERLYRQESASCNMQIGAWASAATDSIRVAELLIPKDATIADKHDLPDAPEYKTLDKRRFSASVFYKQAATAYTEMNEKAKAAQCQVKAAIVLNYGDDSSGRMLSKESLTEMEAAIEAHVPDLLNPHARYRQTGTSAFLGPDETLIKPSAESMELARAHIVTKAYSHEPLFELVYFLASYGEYATALYAAGAASALLQHEGLSTLTLSRSFIMETIVTLAMGDPIAAEEQFLQRHVQHTAYLNSRECKLAEDLFRACKIRDTEALEEARDVTGGNKAALANLHPSLQQLVQEIRVSGVARKHVPDTTSGAATAGKTKGKKEKAVKPEKSLKELANLKTGYEAEVQEGANLDGDALANELDALDFDGLGDDDDDDDNKAGYGDDDDSLEDDEFDLR